MSAELLQSLGIEIKDIIMWAGLAIAFLLQWYINHRLAKQNDERIRGELARFRSQNVGDASEAAERYYKMLTETNERLEKVKASYEERIGVMEKSFNFRISELQKIISGPFRVELEIETRPILRISRHSISIVELGTEVE